MIIIISTENKLRNSKYYLESQNWDYPIEELEYLIRERKEEKTEINKVYVMTEKLRIYETNLEENNICKLLE